MGSLYPWPRVTDHGMKQMLKTLAMRLLDTVLRALARLYDEKDSQDEVLLLQVLDNRRRLARLEEELRLLRGGAVGRSPAEGKFLDVRRE